jgi:hypothetical protein
MAGSLRLTQGQAPYLAPVPAPRASIDRDCAHWRAAATATPGNSSRPIARFSPAIAPAAACLTRAYRAAASVAGTIVTFT